MARKSAPLAGELGLLSLFDLGQLLSLNGATGELVVDSEGRRGYLYFIEGRIVNAVDEQLLTGEECAYRLFAWKRGHFEFRPEPPSTSTPISVSSEALMLEAARRMDESGERGEGAEGEDGGEAAKLRKRQQALDVLRAAFHDAASDASERGAGRDAASVPALEGGGRPDDRTVFRPGHPARVRIQGGWRESRDAALSAAEFAEMSRRMLGGAAEDGGWAITRLAGGRTWGVERVKEHGGDSLWLRPVELPAPEPGRLNGSPEELEKLWGMNDGLLLVGGADADAAQQALHAIVASRTTVADVTLLVTDGPVYRHAEGHGVLCEVAPRELGRALRGVRPSWLALDADAALPEASLAALAAVRLIVARVAGASPASWPARWLAGLAAGDRRTAEAFLASSPVLAVWSEGVANAGQPIAVRVWPVGAPFEAGAAEADAA